MSRNSYYSKYKYYWALKWKCPMDNETLLSKWRGVQACPKCGNQQLLGDGYEYKTYDELLELNI